LKTNTGVLQHTGFDPDLYANSSFLGYPTTVGLLNTKTEELERFKLKQKVLKIIKS